MVVSRSSAEMPWLKLLLSILYFFGSLRAHGSRFCIRQAKREQPACSDKQLGTTRKRLHLKKLARPAGYICHFNGCMLSVLQNKKEEQSSANDRQIASFIFASKVTRLQVTHLSCKAPKWTAATAREVSLRAHHARETLGACHPQELKPSKVARRLVAR